MSAWVFLLLGGMDSIVFGPIRWCVWSFRPSSPLRLPHLKFLFVCLFMLASRAKVLPSGTLHGRERQQQRCICIVLFICPVCMLRKEGCSFLLGRCIRLCTWLSKSGQTGLTVISLSEKLTFDHEIASRLYRLHAGYSAPNQDRTT